MGGVQYTDRVRNKRTYPALDFEHLSRVGEGTV